MYLRRLKDGDDIIKARKLAALGIMLGLIFVLSVLEHLLPPIPFLPPNMRLGLANVVTMYSVFFIGKTAALGLTAGKSAFVFMTRGPIAAMLSLGGGLLSVLAVILLVSVFKSRISYMLIGVISAILHNCGQMLVYSILASTVGLLFYVPVLLVFGVVLGAASGLVLKLVSNGLRGSRWRF